jgi:hypothetical protein
LHQTPSSHSEGSKQNLRSTTERVAPCCVEKSTYARPRATDFTPTRASTQTLEVVVSGTVKAKVTGNRDGIDRTSESAAGCDPTAIESVPVAAPAGSSTEMTTYVSERQEIRKANKSAEIRKPGAILQAWAGPRKP